MTFDLYVWQPPRDLDDEGAGALLKSWQEMGRDPSQSPFEPSTDVGWFYRELMNDAPELDVSSDAVPHATQARSGCRRLTSRLRAWWRCAWCQARRATSSN